MRFYTACLYQVRVASVLQTMAEIFHELPIQAPIGDVYRAITDSGLISSWWLPDSKVGQAVGETATFPLSDGENKIVARIAALVPGQQVVWKCLEHKFPEWIGTTITFNILPAEAEASILQFYHAGWADSSGVFGKTSFYWAAVYLRNLKLQLEKAKS